MSAPCAQPFDLATLVDYWFDEGEEEPEAIEEHLMACEECSGRLRGLVLLGEGVRRSARDVGRYTFNHTPTPS